MTTRGRWLVTLPILLGASPWERPHTPVLSAEALGLSGLKASDCSTCHADVAAEWSTSIHAAAWTDPQFQAELHKDPEVGWLCLNCHTPLANQQASLVTEFDNIRAPVTVPNPSFDPVLRDEGVTCLTCHWREDGIATARAEVRAPHATVHDPELGRGRVPVLNHPKHGSQCTDDRRSQYAPTFGKKMFAIWGARDLYLGRFLLLNHPQ